MAYWILAVSPWQVCWTAVLLDPAIWDPAVLILSAIKPYMSALVSKYFFFMICLTNSMHTSACPLLWWLCGDETAWEMSRHLHKSLKFSTTNFVPASAIFLLESVYSAKIILHVFVDLFGQVANSVNTIMQWHYHHSALLLSSSSVIHVQWFWLYHWWEQLHMYDVFCHSSPIIASWIIWAQGIFFCIWMA